MTERVYPVCWREHTSELATVYKSLLENNFLVDCTISAEGQSLKAHRLVLSASSPYFHMLFGEETGKHPFVVLLNASFETLKAVIDFVYQGEVQIPEGNLKAFLTVAQSLQIKGLDAFTQNYIHQNVSENSARNVYSQCEDNEDACKVGDVSACQEDSPENSSQPLPHHSGRYSNSMHTNSSVPFEPCIDSSGAVQSATLIPPPHVQQTPAGYNEVSEDTEVTVKQEPLFSDFSETENEFGNIKNCEPMSENFTTEMDDKTTFVVGKQDLNQYPSADGLPLEEVLATQRRSLPGQQSTSSLPHTELQLHEGRHAHLGKLTVLSDEGGRALVYLPSTSTQKLRRARKGPLHCNICKKEFQTPSQFTRHLRTHTGDRPFRCDVCSKGFTQSSHLVDHKRRHTGERSYCCEICGMAFARAGTLNDHMHTHTGDRPYSCDVCGHSFTRANRLIRHMRTHKKEPPLCCNVCGKNFTCEDDLACHHRRMHTASP